MDDKTFCFNVVDEYGEHRNFEIEAENEADARINFRKKLLDVRIVWVAQIN